jgi:hypothetical protein
MRRLAFGDLYPVTAAQLLPIFTEFFSSAGYRFMELAKNWRESWAAKNLEAI